MKGSLSDVIEICLEETITFEDISFPVRTVLRHIENVSFGLALSKGNNITSTT